ncbi:MAG: MarR family transcriptional regulator [Acidimicrobiales bacterium]
MSEGRLRDRREVIREEPAMHARIIRALAEGPRTIPQIAAAMGEPPNEVLLWVMGMRRYRQIVEVPDADDEGFFAYALVQEEE